MLRGSSEWPLIGIGHSKGDLERGEGKEGRRGKNRNKVKKKKKIEVFIRIRISGVKDSNILDLPGAG